MIILTREKWHAHLYTSALDADDIYINFEHKWSFNDDPVSGKSTLTATLNTNNSLPWSRHGKDDIIINFSRELFFYDDLSWERRHVSSNHKRKLFFMMILHRKDDINSDLERAHKGPLKTHNPPGYVFNFSLIPRQFLLKRQVCF